MNNNVKVFVAVIAILILGVFATVLVRSNSGSSVASGTYDLFAQCLKDKGMTFYGAFWCPHCQAEKKLFGTSLKFINYVECSTPDAQGQTQICIDKKITGYPTFEFADGSRMNGEIPLAKLAEKTSCILPTGDASAATTPTDTGASSPAIK